MKLFIDSRVAPATSTFNSSSAAQLKDSSILDGSEVHFKCDTEANPNDIRIKWFINDVLVIGDYTTEMVRFSFSSLLSLLICVDSMSFFFLLFES